jgi:hypothetical protein
MVTRKQLYRCARALNITQNLFSNPFHVRIHVVIFIHFEVDWKGILGQAADLPAHCIMLCSSDSGFGLSNITVSWIAELLASFSL